QAFGIIGNPAKMDPRTRQSADHSMAYIVATLLRKALEYRANHGAISPSLKGGGQGAGQPAVNTNSVASARNAKHIESSKDFRPSSASTHSPAPALSGRGSTDAIWKALMLMPADYHEDATALFHPLTRALMKK